MTLTTEFYVLPDGQALMAELAEGASVSYDGATQTDRKGYEKALAAYEKEQERAKRAEVKAAVDAYEADQRLRVEAANRLVKNLGLSVPQAAAIALVDPSLVTEKPKGKDD